MVPTMKMNPRIGVGVLLVLCGFWLPTVSSRMMKRLSREEEGPVVKLINELRSAVAKEAQIANMNEIAYDRDLEKIAKEMKCNTMLNGPNYMVAILPNEQGMKEMLAISDEAKAERIMKLLGGLVASGQTKFGCHEFTPPCLGKNGNAIAGVCAVGPQTEFRKSDAKQGEPGSMCPNGATPEGLCLLPKKKVHDVETNKKVQPIKTQEPAEVKSAENDESNSTLSFSSLSFYFSFALTFLLFKFGK